MSTPADIEELAHLRIMLTSANDECAAVKAQLLGATASNEGLRKERAELQGVIARARAEVRAFQEQAASTAPEIERRLDDVDDALMGAYGYTRGDAEWEKLTTDLAACTALLEERTREIKVAHDIIDEAGGIPNRDPKVGELTLLQRVRMLADDLGVMERACSRRGADLIIATERADNAEARAEVLFVGREDAESRRVVLRDRCASLESENAGLRELVTKTQLFIDAMNTIFMYGATGYTSQIEDVYRVWRRFEDVLFPTALSDAPPATEYRAEDDERICVTCSMPGNCHVDSPLNRDHVYAPPAATTCTNESGCVDEREGKRTAPCAYSCNREVAPPANKAKP